MKTGSQTPRCWWYQDKHRVPKPKRVPANPGAGCIEQGHLLPPGSADSQHIDEEKEEDEAGRGFTTKTKGQPEPCDNPGEETQLHRSSSALRLRRGREKSSVLRWDGEMETDSCLGLGQNHARGLNLHDKGGSSRVISGGGEISAGRTCPAAPGHRAAVPTSGKSSLGRWEFLTRVGILGTAEVMLGRRSRGTTAAKTTTQTGPS